MYLRRNSKHKMEVSIDEPLNVDWDGNELLLSENREETWVEHISLSEAMKKLSEREHEIITLRFFEGKTQMEVANRIGISQAQVSRLEILGTDEDVIYKDIENEVERKLLIKAISRLSERDFVIRNLVSL